MKVLLFNEYVKLLETAANGSRFINSTGVTTSPVLLRQNLYLDQLHTLE